jgi:hypothetical protein
MRLKRLRLGPCGTLIAMAIWIAAIAYITHEAIWATFTGHIVSTYYTGGTGANAEASKARFMMFTILTCITFAYILLVRLLLDGSRRSSRTMFFWGTTILCVLQMPMLISASTLLVQYIRSEGMTLMRVGGVVYTLVSLAALFGASRWAYGTGEARKGSNHQMLGTASPPEI